MKLLVKVFSAMAFFLFGLLSILPHHSLAESDFDTNEKMEKSSIFTKQDEPRGREQELQDDQEMELENSSSDLFKQQTEAKTKAEQAEVEAEVKTIKNNLFTGTQNTDSEFKHIEKVLFSSDYIVQKQPYESSNNSFNTIKFVQYSAFGGVLAIVCVGIYFMLKKWFR